MKENAFNEKKLSWLNLFMYGYLIVETIFLANSIGGEIPEEYKNNLTLFWVEKVCTLSICAFSLYTFLAFFYKWRNAVYISYVFLGGIIFMNCANVIYGIGNVAEAKTLVLSAFQIIIAILWLIYFKYSKEVNSLFLHEERQLFGRDLIICSVFAIISLLSFWSTFSKPSLSTTSVVEGMELTESNQPSLLIDE